MYKIVLPMPISINQAYSTNKRTGSRFKSQKYKDWESLAMTSKNNKFTYRKTKGMVLSFSYIFYSNWITKDGKPRIKDLSNFLKVLEDYLPNCIDGFDDSFIFEYEGIKKVHSDREEVEIVFKETPLVGFMSLT